MCTVPPDYHVGGMLQRAGGISRAPSEYGVVRNLPWTTCSATRSQRP